MRYDIAPLDEAWREAEAALPEGWQMGAIIPTVRFSEGFEPTRSTVRWGASAYNGAFSKTDGRLEGRGPTPVAALRDLAALLYAASPDPAQGET